jgi:hypothetical protein
MVASDLWGITYRKRSQASEYLSRILVITYQNVPNDCRRAIMAVRMVEDIPNI